MKLRAVNTSIDLKKTLYFDLGKGKVVPVLNKLSMPCRHVGEWLYRSTFS
jgi:hypothetical protein